MLTASQTVRTVAGVAVALVAMELALRPFGSALHNAWQTVPVLRDADAGRPVTVREFHEGIAVSHYSAAHARLTGEPWIAGAPVGVILGDSYIEARQVADSETVGGQAERWLRRTGRPMNVRQYGWSGAGVQQYVAIAPELLARWTPAWVAVSLNDQDLREADGMSPTDSTLPPLAPRKVLGSRASAEAVARQRSGRLQALLQRVTEHSVLAYEATLRFVRLRAGGDAADERPHAGIGPPPARAIAIKLDALRRAYGDRLVVLYVATLPPDAVAGDSLGALLLASCRATAVRCASTEAGMRRVQRDSARFPRGFSNSTPGEGHPNALGHRVMAETLESVLPPG